MQKFYSHGKLLLTGEYVVLDGAMALAAPTKRGQSLEIASNDHNGLHWTSIDDQNLVWFRTEIQIEDGAFKSDVKTDLVLERLVQILNAANSLNPEFAGIAKGCNARALLEFPRAWGLGSSSTLINNIAAWAKVNPYKLLELTFGGSGYDIACANQDGPLVYQREGSSHTVSATAFDPIFKEHLYFVYLNKKQNSQDAISQYKTLQVDQKQISEVNVITNKWIDCKDLSSFMTLIDTHEKLLSSILKISPIKALHFSDFKGSIKSLGAWGGDFILAASIDDPRSYFRSKGFDVILPYSDMIL
ncbi:MAG: GHMP kinase [Flavobacteriaceae bacterium]|nr:GHMP kinase [Flavobacteriaceae bacterium]